MLKSLSKKEHMSAFYEFLKGTHPKAQSDVKYLPRDVLEIILTEYVFKSFDHMEMIKYGLNNFFYKKMFSKPHLFSQYEISRCAIYCCIHGNPEVLKWLYDETKKRNIKVKNIHLMDIAAGNGQLDVIKFLHNHNNQESANKSRADPTAEEIICTTYAMNRASRNGHLDVVIWLHNNRTEGCTTEAMDWAARNGHIHVVQFLHFNRTEGCTTNAMDWAARNGHLHVVKWLHNNRTEGCTENAMDGAAENGHLEVVEWLHFNRTEGCTTEAMDLAAEFGYLDVVIFLHENRSEGCTEKAKLCALEYNHHHILEWLRVHYPQLFLEN